jgi:type VI secretion system ImpA family protein
MTVVDPRLLSPIPGERPTGENLRYDRLYHQIVLCRRSDDLDSPGVWEQEVTSPNWRSVAQLTSEAIATRSKDLLLAAWLTEAKMQLEGLRGASEGLELVRELITRYWDGELYPLSDEDGAEPRAAVLEWLDRMLSSSVYQRDVTAKGNNTDEIKLWRFLERGRNSATQEDHEAFHSAVSLTDFFWLQSQLGEAQSVAQGLEQLEEILRAKLDIRWSGFPESRRALRELCDVLTFESTAKGQAGVDKFDNYESSAAKVDGGRIGSTEAGAEPKEGAPIPPHDVVAESGRERFFRKLHLAKECFDVGEKRIAAAILEELVELIDQLQLDRWESQDTIAHVWLELYKCHENAADGSVHAQLRDRSFERLCRTDPWLAASALKKR